MSRSRRNFSAEFKTNLVLQLLKGEKELNVLAVENDIQPNLLRNWKKEFLANASLAFDNKREDNLREQHHNEFGLRWLLRRFNICPNAYYNYRKHRKADHYARRGKVLSKMVYRFYLFVFGKP